MNAPLSEVGVIGPRAALLVALPIGIAFGWCLERAGLGSARKMMGQFDLSDLAVLKVMFSAILTAALGLFWLARLGVVNPALVYVPETVLLPQIIGAIVFGVGMATAGLCPGTSCVAAATGRLDGLAVMGGLLAGVLATALLLPALGSFYMGGVRDTLTMPELLGVEPGAVMLALVALALGAFALAERVERATARRRGARA